MSNIASLNRLMNEIGPALGLGAVFEIRENAEWELILAENFSLAVHYEPSDDRLTITGRIAELGPQPPRDILITMLQYNSASTDTGGIRLALDAELRAEQIYDMPVAGLTLDAFKNIVLNLADKIVAWQGALNGQADTQAPPKLGLLSLGFENMIMI
jgi:hypothetical protein